MKTTNDVKVHVEEWGETSVAFHLLNNHNRLTKLERESSTNILRNVPKFNLSTKTPVTVNLSGINKNNLVTAHTETKDFMGVWADHGNDSFTLYAGNDYITFKANSEGKIYPAAMSVSAGTCTFDTILAIRGGGV